MRGFVRMRRNDEIRPGRKSGLTPPFAHRRLVNLKRAEMVLSVSFAGRPAGAERFLGLFRGKVTQIGVFESFLRNAGNLPPILRRFPHPHGLAEGAVRPIVTELIRMQPQEQVTETILKKLPPQNELEGAVLRLVLEYPRDWEKLIDEAALRQYAAGTFELHLVKRPQVEARIRLPEDRAVGSLSPLELLEVYWDGSHVPEDEQVELKKLAEEIIRDSGDGVD